MKTADIVMPDVKTMLKKEREVILTTAAAKLFQLLYMKVDGVTFEKVIKMIEQLKTQKEVS